MRQTSRTHLFRSLFRVYFVAVCGLGVTACPPDPDPKPNLTKFSGIYESYLKGCGDCHAPDNIVYTDEVTNLDLSSKQAAYESLKRERALKRVQSLGCSETVSYVVAGEPSVSILYAILDADTRESFNAGSDPSCRPNLHTLADGGQANNPKPEEKEAIKSWITNGAAND